MNFLADESVDKQIVERLRKEGYIVGYIAESDPGLSDNAVLELANKDEVPLLTADKDFAELIFRLGHLSTGIILIRLAGLSSMKKAEIAIFLIKKHLSELKGAFVVITPTGIRIRHV